MHLLSQIVLIHGIWLEICTISLRLIILYIFTCNFFFIRSTSALFSWLRYLLIICLHETRRCFHSWRKLCLSIIVVNGFLSSCWFTSLALCYFTTLPSHLLCISLTLTLICNLCKWYLLLIIFNDLLCWSDLWHCFRNSFKFNNKANKQIW